MIKKILWFFIAFLLLMLAFITFYENPTDENSQILIKKAEQIDKALDDLFPNE